MGAGEFSEDGHKSLNIKEGVSYFPFDYTVCKFITDLFFTNVGLVLTICLRAKQTIHFRMTQKRKCLNYYVLFQDCSLSPALEYMPNWLGL